MGKDFLNGDFSFKNWVKIMWKNWYLQPFLGALGINIWILLSPVVVGSGL